MDRNLRAPSSALLSPRMWARAFVLGAFVAGGGLTLGLAAPTSALAADAAGRSMSVPLAENAPERYVVKKGDTLWHIAGVFLKDPWYWPEIWYVNPNIANPHLIYPGDELYLTYVDGKPRITVDKPGSVRLSPQVRSEPLSGAIRAIPYDLLMDFVGRPQLLDAEQVKKAPYVMGMRDRHLVGSTENEIYAKGLGNPAPGSRYTVVHVGEELRDPDDGDKLGYIGHFAATGEVIQTTGAVVPGSKSIFKMEREEDLTHLRVLATGREIMQGDKVFPAAVDVGDDFVLSTPSNKELLGQIIAIVDGVYVGGKYQVLAINRGKQHGLVPGNALAVFYRGDEIRDRYSHGQDWMKYTAYSHKVRLPDERSATILVFKVYDRMSYGLVVESSQLIRLGDFVAPPAYGHRDSGHQDFIR